MKDTESSQPSSNNYISELGQLYSVSSRQKKEISLSYVDEAPDFYDPYSDLNLFLSQKIKQEMQHCGCHKKWSPKIQEALIEKIGPEFQEKFPQYRLGVLALKKTWEKVGYYLQQIEPQKQAITEEGKLNTPFLIKENLKQYLCLKNPPQLHPSQFAHQLALKLSECIATIDGKRPKLDQLTKMIWSVQRHLIKDASPEQLKSPYDTCDQIDKLIVKTILGIKAKEPQISYDELIIQVKESLQALHELPSFSSLDALYGNIAALFAEKLYAASHFHTQYFAEQKRAILNFISRHSALCKSATLLPQLYEQVRRIGALYTLASQLPKELKEEEIKAAIGSIYPTPHPTRPLLSQAVYAFISAELVLMRNEEYCHSIEYTTQAIWAAYQEAIHLPPLNEKDGDLLEIAIWKTLSGTEGLLEKLPYRIGQKIEEEIANILIDSPENTFAATVHATVQFFKRAKEFDQEEIEQKIHIWAVQGDMLCHLVHMSRSNTLLKEIMAARNPQHVSHADFVREIAVKYLIKYPKLSCYREQVTKRIWILYKCAWYTLFANPQESSYDRFVAWHVSHFQEHGFEGDENAMIQHISEVVSQSTPLTPFDPEHTRQKIAFYTANRSLEGQREYSSTVPS
jgi:hypothetical protein